MTHRGGSDRDGGAAGGEHGGHSSVEGISSNARSCLKPTRQPHQQKGRV